MTAEPEPNNQGGKKKRNEMKWKRKEKKEKGLISFWINKIKIKVMKRKEKPLSLIPGAVETESKCVPITMAEASEPWGVFAIIFLFFLKKKNKNLKIWNFHNNNIQNSNFEEAKNLFPLFFILISDVVNTKVSPRESETPITGIFREELEPYYFDSIILFCWVNLWNLNEKIWRLPKVPENAPWALL